MSELHLVDINPSQGQGGISVAQLERDGIDALWGKTSEGVGWSVPAEETMRLLRIAWDRGMPGGAYHFAWGAGDPDNAKNHADNMAQTMIRAMGGADVAKRFGLCLDVETYNGQVPPRRQDVLWFYRHMQRRLGDVEMWYYGGNWYHNVYIDKPGQVPLLQVLNDEGIRVHAWTTPDSGYVEGPGTVQGLAARLPAREWNQSFGVQTKMIQATAEARTTELAPVDGNVVREGITLKELGALFNRS